VDQKNGVLDEKFRVAANYLIDARDRLEQRRVPEEMGKNERFFTGAMANAINSVLQNGYCVLHQACLGTGATHSDLSATCIKKNSRPTTLMVGEGKWQASNLRVETRGQIFNEMLRHRAIDKRPKQKEANNGPILLVAFDKTKVEIDLAFPSTKGGKLDQDNVVAFGEHVGSGKETFWTVQILRMSIEDANGQANLPILLRFLSEALEKLDAWSRQPRVQRKMPMSFNPQVDGGGFEVIKYCGENVTIVRVASGSIFVCKEYCYHLREASDFMMPLHAIKETGSGKFTEDLLASRFCAIRSSKATHTVRQPMGGGRFYSRYRKCTRLASFMETYCRATSCSTLTGVAL